MALPNGKWVVSADSQPKSHRRASFGHVEYRFIFEESEEVMPRTARFRSPSPAPRGGLGAAQSEPGNGSEAPSVKPRPRSPSPAPRAAAKKAVVETKPEAPKSGQKASEPATNAGSPSSDYPSVAHRKFSDVVGAKPRPRSSSPALKPAAKKPAAKKTAVETKPDAPKGWQKASEAATNTGAPSSDYPSLPTTNGSEAAGTQPRPRSPSPAPKAAGKKAAAKKAAVDKTAVEKPAVEKKPDAPKGWQTTSEAATKTGSPSSAYPSLPSTKRSQAEVEMADLVLLCLQFQKAIPPARQIMLPPNVKQCFAQLAPSGEESEVRSWMDGAGFSLGPHSKTEKILSQLRQFAARLESLVADSIRVGSIPASQVCCG